MAEQNRLRAPAEAGDAAALSGALDAMEQRDVPVTEEEPAEETRSMARIPGSSLPAELAAMVGTDVEIIDLEEQGMGSGTPAVITHWVAVTQLDGAEELGQEICAEVTFGDRWAVISANNLAPAGATRQMHSRRRAARTAIRLQLQSALAAMERGAPQQERRRKKKKKAENVPQPEPEPEPQPEPKPELAEAGAEPVETSGQSEQIPFSKVKLAKGDVVQVQIDGVGILIGEVTKALGGRNETKKYLVYCQQSDTTYTIETRKDRYRQMPKPAQQSPDGMVTDDAETCPTWLASGLQGDMWRSLGPIKQTETKEALRNIIKAGRNLTPNEKKGKAAASLLWERARVLDGPATLAVLEALRAEKAEPQQDGAQTGPHLAWTDDELSIIDETLRYCGLYADPGRAVPNEEWDQVAEMANVDRRSGQAIRSRTQQYVWGRKWSSGGMYTRSNEDGIGEEGRMLLAADEEQERQRVQHDQERRQRAEEATARQHGLTSYMPPLMPEYMLFSNVLVHGTVFENTRAIIESGSLNPTNLPDAGPGGALHSRRGDNVFAGLSGYAMVAHMLSRMTRARHINNGIAMQPIAHDRAPFPAMGNITVFALVDQDPRLWNRGFQPNGSHMEHRTGYWEYFTDRPVPITDSTPRKAFAIFTTDLDELRSIVHSIEEWVLTECGGEALEKGAPMPGKFPLSKRSADARKLVRKMEMEAYFRGGEQKVRKMAAAQRLAWSLVMNDRLGADSPALALPFDLVQECSAAVARIHRSYQPGSSIYFGDEHWITLRYEPSDHPSQPSMLLARRGHRGLTAFLTEKCILIGVADMDLHGRPGGAPPQRLHDESRRLRRLALPVLTVQMNQRNRIIDTTGITQLSLHLIRPGGGLSSVRREESAVSLPQRLILLTYS